jgi:hypothetical protein
MLRVFLVYRETRLFVVMVVHHMWQFVNVNLNFPCVMPSLVCYLRMSKTLDQTKRIRLCTLLHRQRIPSRALASSVAP